MTGVGVGTLFQRRRGVRIDPEPAENWLIGAADGRADVMSAPAAPAMPVIAATGDGTATIEE